MKTDKRFRAFLLLVWLIGLCDALKASYNGDQVWRYLPTFHAESSFVEDFLENHRFDIWSSNRGGVDFRVPKDDVAEVVSAWRKRNIPFKILIDDVGKLIEEERLGNDASRSTDDSFSFDHYHPLNEISSYLDQLAAESNLVTLQEIGTTYEGRTIRLAKLTSKAKVSSKPAVWIDCGIHAREWISPATCLWGLNYLTTQYGINGAVTTFIDNFDLYILPVLNLDGYDYTWTNDRLWRKNRIEYPENKCLGVDLNRNYDDGHWGEVGSSTYSCDETYHGPSPFSELETKAVREKVTSIQKSQDVKAFFSLHSYSQVWLFAFGWTAELPPEADELYRVSDIGIRASRAVNGTVYRNGPTYTAIYPAAGTAGDWGYSVGIVQSYVIELRDTGEYGFLLPEDQILPTAEEAWAGMIAAINAI